MSGKNKDFYIWIVTEFIKSKYEYFNIDMMSIMYCNIEKNFPNAIESIRRIHRNFESPSFYSIKSLQFEKPQYVYEALYSLIPAHEQLNFDLRTKNLSKEYKNLNMCSKNHFVSIHRLNLFMYILLFTEEFILLPITSKYVAFTDNKLTVYENFVTLKVSKHQDKTYISIRIRNVMLLEYVILN